MIPAIVFHSIIVASDISEQFKGNAVIARLNTSANVTQQTFIIYSLKTNT